MQKVSAAPRIEWIDFAKGVVIILMVFLHITRFEDLSKFIMLFHMPFFFVTAGFLLNLNRWGGAENFKPFATKLFRRLLVPYFLAEILWYPIWFFVCHKAGFLNHLWEWSNFDTLKSFLAIFIGNGNAVGLILGQLWFLPTLFVAEIIFICLYNRFAKIGGEIFVIAVVACSAIGLNVKVITDFPFGMDIALVSQIFLLTGVLVRRYNFVDRMNLKTCVVLELILLCAFFFNARVDMNFRFYGNALLFYAGGVAGTLIVMKLSVLAVKVGGKICAVIEDCGRQSMMILVLHPIIANIFYEVIVRAVNFPPEEILTEPTIIFAVTILGTLVPLLVAKKFGRLPVLKNFCV